MEKLESLANPSNDIEMESYTQLVLRAATAAPRSFLFIDNTAAATLLLWQKKQRQKKGNKQTSLYRKLCTLRDLRLSQRILRSLGTGRVVADGITTSCATPPICKCTI